MAQRSMIQRGSEHPPQSAGWCVFFRKMDEILRRQGFGILYVFCSYVE